MGIMILKATKAKIIIDMILKIFFISQKN